MATQRKKARAKSVVKSAKKTKAPAKRVAAKAAGPAPSRDEGVKLSRRLRGRDYISTQDFALDEIELLLDTSAVLKKKFKAGTPHRHLQDKTLFMMFFDKSTRTRNSMEAGMTQLGGHAHYLTEETMQVSHGETPQDTGIILSSYGHGIAIRHDLVPGEGNAYMREIAKWSSVPVINLQCDVDHPCQTLADLMTIREKFGKNLRGRKIAVSWAYTNTYAKPLSVPQGLILLMTRMGLDVTLAHPPEFRLMPDVVAQAEKNARESGTAFRVTNKMEDAFENADVVYPKSWGCLELFGRPEEALKIGARYTDWKCDTRRMSLAKKESIYMHCLPADRKHEVEGAVIDGRQSVVFQEAENRLHTGKAIMALTM
ncbi:MAG: ornithine carbamoyltransferase [bacterium]